jgi:Uma2 family endonuclease
MIEVAEEKRLITVEEYYQMAEFGILKPDESVELINGEIIKMSPIKSKHGGYVTRIVRLMYKYIGDDIVTVPSQNPIRLSDYSEPEPDVIIAKYSENEYQDNHPTIEDIYFLVEVSDSTLRYDQTKKARLYANHNVLTYWILNLVKNQLEIYENPIDGKYLTKTILKRGDKAIIPHFNIEINVSEIIK